jgi:hypothetical protein
MKPEPRHAHTSRFPRGLAAWAAGLLWLLPGGVAATRAADAPEPRIVNLYCFCRDNDFRLADSEKILLAATREEVRLIKAAKLPATFALQYDALVDTNYQKLFREQLPANCEIGAWWEIPQALAEKAGLKWYGRHEWDPAADVGFSPGYTPSERRRLVDVYMADFKRIFGTYPKTAGSWYIDEETLAYMASKYGVIASCNCKDQIGTDFYTLWGGYWNQAYYPSKLNAYMPAQTRAGQIDVPIFRMLGSDPIYQHGTTPGMCTLEPVYREAGGSADWVGWFMDNLIGQPALVFGYAQAGQENSFGWDAMRDGLTQQVALIAAKARAHQLRVETLAESGQWFRKHYSVTPPTTVVALNDWKHQGRRTVWYDSRFYRLNLLWQGNTFFIRDLHCFDEKVVSPTHVQALSATSLAYETLPVMDWALWSPAEGKSVGMWPVLLAGGGGTSALVVDGAPVVRELNAEDLSIQQPLAGGGNFSLVCAEGKVICIGVDGQGKPLRWAWELTGGRKLKSVVHSVAPTGVSFRYQGTDYQLRLPPGAGSCRQLANGDIQIAPEAAGKIVMVLAGAGQE